MHVLHLGWSLTSEVPRHPEGSRTLQRRHGDLEQPDCFLASEGMPQHTAQLKSPDAVQIKFQKEQEPKTKKILCAHGHTRGTLAMRYRSHARLWDL